MIPLESASSEKIALFVKLILEGRPLIANLYFSFSVRNINHC